MDDDQVEESTVRPRLFPRLLIGGIGAVILMIAGVLLTQNPGDGGPLIILLLLLLVFMLVFLLSVTILRSLSPILGKGRLSGARVLYTSVAVATGVVYIIGLQTLSQLQVIDIVLVVVFELLLNFYLLRRF